jgi:hypothetical protein
MKKTIKKIREQPLHVRETIMWVSSISVFFVIGVIWVSDFQGDMYALLNQDEIEEIRDTAVAENDKEASPFAALLTTVGDIRSGITDFMGRITDREKEEEVSDKEIITLPLSE